MACAGGEPIFAAGELAFEIHGNQPSVIEVSNLSTGYCPEPECWEELRTALEYCGIPHPEELTMPIIFRRCEKCGQRNIVKDEWYVCVCGATLPEDWNFDSAENMG